MLVIDFVRDSDMMVERCYHCSMMVMMVSVAVDQEYSLKFLLVSLNQQQSPFLIYSHHLAQSYCSTVVVVVVMNQ